MIGRLAKLATGAALAAATVLGGAHAAHAYTYCCTKTYTYTPPPRMVFLSSRSGQMEIWSANGDGSSPTQLTTGYGQTDPSFDAARAHVAFAGYKPNNTFGIWLMNADGSYQHLLSPASSAVPAYQPSLNAAGTKIAYSSNVPGGSSQIYVMNADGTGVTQLTSDGASGSTEPAWSPDGQHIAYSHYAAGVFDVWMMNADGSGAHRVTYDGYQSGRPTWSPDSQRIAYTSYRTGTAQISWSWAFSTQAPVQVTSRPANDTQPTWSPDGGSIVFSESTPNNSSVLLSVNLSNGAVTTVANAGWNSDANFGYPSQQAPTMYAAY